MLNAGATIDLLDFLEIRTDINIYVMDSHRPYNLHNLFSYNNV